MGGTEIEDADVDDADARDQRWDTRMRFGRKQGRGAGFVKMFSRLAAAGIMHAMRDDSRTGDIDATLVGDLAEMLTRQGRVDATIAAGGEVAGEEREIERGAAIGRYVVLGRLGAGGMGVVYAAYDPELDRKVAIKLLQAAVGLGTAASLGRTRLLREAQALAKLSHPHVVAVHDVGTFRDRVWLAMEYVDGVTLGGWIAQRRRGWVEILDVMRRVGEGLAAAHAAGLVHRDLKPDNVMVGRDGRVRVMDFGLARAAGDVEPARSADEIVTSTARLAALALPVTQAGAVMGTPAYMAPEQWRGEETDARADQFAYCVTLWEALYGARPFVGDTAANLVIAVLTGDLQAPPRGSAVPSWLRKVLVRGLQVESELRFPTMDALLVALAEGAGRKRRRRIAAAACVCAVGIAAVPAWMHYQRVRGLAGCEAAAAEILDVWNDEARAELGRALLGSGVGYAATTHEKMLPWIDRWSAAWADTRGQVCRAAEVEGTTPETVYAEEVACLAERREELAALLGALGEDGQAAVARAVQAVAGLTPPATCTDRAALARRPPPPDPATQSEAAQLRREAMRVHGLATTGRYADALVRAEALYGRAQALDHAPLTVVVGGLLGEVAEKSYKLGRAEEVLTRAYVEAGALGLDEVAADAAVELVYVTGAGQARFEAGVQWSHAAELLVRRLGKTDDVVGGRLYNNLAVVHKQHGDLDEAEALYRRALGIREAQLGAEHPEVGGIVNNIANLLWARGRMDDAHAYFRRALGIFEQAYGVDHPHVALVLNNIAGALWERGKGEEAWPLHVRALAIREGAYGPDHPEVASSLANMALILVERGDYAGARALDERALAIREAAFGPEHPVVADNLSNLAHVRLRLGDLDAAEGLEARALGIRERAFGAEHPDVAFSLYNLGEIRRDRGQYGEAQALLERCLAIREKTLGADDREVAGTVVVLAQVLLLRRDVAGARALIERALPLSERVFGAEDLVTATTLVAAGDLERIAGELDAAGPLYERALAIWEARGAANGPRACLVMLGLGELALARGRPGEAIPRLERAAAQCSGHEMVAARAGLERARRMRGP